MKLNATARALAAFEIIATYPFEGVSTTEISNALGTTPTNATRAAQALQQAGWVCKLENGRWGVSAKPLQILQEYAQQVKITKDRLDVLHQIFNLK